jgi:hypothetical protein
MPQDFVLEHPMRINERADKKLVRGAVSLPVPIMSCRGLSVQGRNGVWAFQSFLSVQDRFSAVPPSGHLQNGWIILVHEEISPEGDGIS